MDTPQGHNKANPKSILKRAYVRALCLLERNMVHCSVLMWVFPFQRAFLLVAESPGYCDSTINHLESWYSRYL